MGTTRARPSLALLGHVLDALARTSRMREAISRSFVHTGQHKDRVRRSAVVQVVAAELKLKPWQVGNALYLEVTRMLTKEGWGLVNRSGIDHFVGVRPVSGAHEPCGPVTNDIPVIVKAPTPATVPQPKPGSKAFEELRASWYAKADPLGEDLEDASDPDAPLSNRGVPSALRPPQTRQQSAATAGELERFRAQASRFLHAHRFRDTREMRIWQGVARGEAAQDIALAVRMRKASVLKVIRRLRENMNHWVDDEGEAP